MHYFAEDGSYGSCSVYTFDTSEWTESMWSVIHEAADRDRMFLAIHFDSGLHAIPVKPEDGKVCMICDLTAYQLGSDET